jgi:hypothetical protein
MYLFLALTYFSPPGPPSLYFFYKMIANTSFWFRRKWYLDLPKWRKSPTLRKVFSPFWEYTLFHCKQNGLGYLLLVVWTRIPKLNIAELSVHALIRHQNQRRINEVPFLRQSKSNSKICCALPSPRPKKADHQNNRWYSSNSYHLLFGRIQVDLLFIKVEYNVWRT